jgi:secondary thiamine-phosphate synthase enzyme
MRVLHDTLRIQTPGRGLHPFQRKVLDWLQRRDAKSGLVNLFIQHTSASLLIQENADPDVCGDLERFMARLVKDGDPLFLHTAEGPDDMSAHIRAALTQTHLSLPVVEGALALGTWQGLYLYEHRTAANTRSVVISYLGE